MTFANEREHPFTREDHIKWKIDNPFDLDFHAKAILNGEELPPSRVCGAGYNPCVPESFADELEGKRAVDHYGLDPSCGWMIWRCSFPWKTKKHPSIKSLSLSLHPEPVPIPGPHFRVSAPGDSFSFTHPETGVVHTLTVVEYEKQTMNLSRMPKQDVEYPPHYTAMSYIVSPELSQEELTLSDCAGSDQPRAKPTPEENMFLPSSKSAIGVIGGGDGPVVFMMRTLSKEKTASVCSSLHFEPVEDVEWRITFRVNRFEEKTVELIS